MATIVVKQHQPGALGCETGTTGIVDAITGQSVSKVPSDAIIATGVIESDGKRHISVGLFEGALDIPNASTPEELAEAARRLGITDTIILY